jgi:uncharacterized protein YbaA (DUF1428 family)
MLLVALPFTVRQTVQMTTAKPRAAPSGTPTAEAVDVEGELLFLRCLAEDVGLRALISHKLLFQDEETTIWLEYLLTSYNTVAKRRLVADPRSLTVLQQLVQDKEPWRRLGLSSMAY